MNKFHVKDKLSEYIDGMLSREEVSAIKEHLDRCSECMEEYEEMVKIIGHMNQMESLDTPDSFLEKIHDRIEKPKPLKRMVKGLFFPLKVKIPLELAGVAAAALLVIYIVGIRGKQHVYELAYTQRSLPLSSMQDKKQVTAAEADEAATPSKKDLAALAPQEKRMEKQSNLEEAVPRSKMVQEKGERDLEPQKEAIKRKAQIVTETPSVAKAPSVAEGQKGEELNLEIADKEKGKAEKDVFTKPTTREEYLQDIIAAVGGKIIEPEYNKDTQVLESLIIEIPSEKYPKLFQTLEERGEIQKPYPTIKEGEQEIIRIRIILQQ